MPGLSESRSIRLEDVSAADPVLPAFQREAGVMRSLIARAGGGGGVAALALAAIISAGLVLVAAHAESRSSTTINGKTIAVVGGSSQSLSSSGEKTVVKLDGREIVISGGRIAFDDSVLDVGDFTKLEIHAEDGRLDIFVDGERVSAASP
jgi:hypothetical protein